MTCLLDTNVMIDCLRNKEAAISLLKQRASTSTYLYASEVSRAEILAGAKAREMTAIEEFFLLFEWIDVDERISRSAGEMAADYRRKFSSITMEDFLIASTAAEVGAELLTLNIKDFPMFPGLSRPY